MAVRTAAMLSLAALIGGACTAGNGDRAEGPSATTGRSFTRQLTLASALQPFAACDDLLEHLHKEGADRVTAYGLAGTGGYFGGPMIDGPVRGEVQAALTATTIPAGAAAPTASDEATSAANAGPTFSSTNTVEAGIDEADVVKTDGTYLYLLSGGQLKVVATNGGQPQKLASLGLPGYPSQLLKVGDTLLVLGQPEYVQPSGGAEPAGDRIGIMPVPGITRQALWQVDVADPGSPKLQRQLIVDGTIIGARLTGEVARVVVQSSPQALPFVYPTGPNEERAERTNREIIEESEIEDWIGGYELRDASGDTISEGMLAGCSSVARPPEFHGFSTTTVLSVDLSKGLSEPNGASVLADGQQIYSSKDHLYVAIGAWQDPAVLAEGGVPDPADQGQVTTAIHRFSYAGSASAYTATGEVTGSLMNDFSMSEHDGVLRVATTAGAPWFWGMGPNSESFVTTLRESDGELAEVGQVGGLGKGERIYAVRFIGTNGYVVTFRQTDPLYVVDLADPTQPTVTGELKIPGYSAYLHPVGDGRLLGIGQDASDQGRVTGGQVSLFDVSDPANPQRIAQHNVGAGQLNAEFDYKAFLWWAPENLVLLPANTYGDQGQYFSGIIGIDVGDTTLGERGRISANPAQENCVTPQPPTPSSPGFPGCGWYGGFISRSVVVDDVVYGIGEGFVSASAISDLSPLGQANLF